MTIFRSLGYYAGTVGAVVRSPRGRAAACASGWACGTQVFR